MKKNAFLGVLLFSLSAWGSVQREVFHYAWENGDRWLKVEALTDEILHFELFEGKNGPQKDPIWTSPMLDPERYRQLQGAESFRVHKDPGIETKVLRVTFSPDLRHVRFFDKVRNEDLTTFRSEKLNESVKTIHIEKLKIRNVYGVGNLFLNNQSADGDWVGRLWNARGHGNFRFGQDLSDNFDSGGPSISQFPMIFALGDRASKGHFTNYGLLFDQIYKISWNFRDVSFENSTGWTASMWGDQIRWFFIAGPNLQALRKNYTQLVGTSPIPPKNILGHWTSEFGYDNWAEIEEDVRSLRNNDFPLEGVALDIQWFGGTFGSPSSHRMGYLQFDEQRFPEPKKRIQEFYKRYGIRFMPIEESYVDQALDDFRAMADHEYRRRTVGFNHFSFEPYNACYLARHSFEYDAAKKTWHPVYVTTNYKQAGDPNTQLWWGTGGMIDWSNPNARLYWHQLKRYPLSTLGITAHWLDLGEPEMYYEYSVYQGLPELSKHDHGSIHNLYNLLWAKGIREGYDRNARELQRSLSEFHGFELEASPRHFAMSRAGTVGIHRYSALWSGDVFSNMGNLRAHLGTQRDMSLLGVDLYSSDTGGFFHGGRTPDDPKDREIVTQWAANSALLDNPLRPHGWGLQETTDFEKWASRFSLDARGDLDSNRANVRRRYELIPYVYSLAHIANREGTPMYPPLVYYFQDDTHARTLGNIKMIGPSLLFAVVATEGEHQRKVYLPRGTWIDYENHEWFYSQGEETKYIPLWRKERVPAAELKDHPDRRFFLLPLFARMGAIVPLMHVDRHTLNVYGKRSDNTIHNELIVRVYSSKEETSFTLYEDDGITRAYQNGRVRTTVISQRLESKNQQIIEINGAMGSYAGAPPERENIIELVTDGRRAQAVTLEVRGQRFSCGTTKDCWFEPGPGLIRIGTRKIPVQSGLKVFVTLLGAVRK